MFYKSWDVLIEKVKQLPQKQKVVIAAADDELALEAISKASDIVSPILVGNKEKILELCQKHNIAIDDRDIYDENNDECATELSINLIKEGKADFLMKGKLQTSTLLKGVVNRENGLGTGRTMCHVGIQTVDSYHKMFATSDGGMVLNPDLKQKKDIIENVVELMHTLGYKKPKVAVLTAVEYVNPKMPETVDAQQLKEMNERGEISGCIVDGPISLDIAMFKEKAEVKGYFSEVAGDADILIMPNIAAGNIFGKATMDIAGAKFGGVILGAKVPIILPSRASTSEEKYLSIVLAAAGTIK